MNRVVVIGHTCCHVIAVARFGQFPSKVRLPYDAPAVPNLAPVMIDMSRCQVNIVFFPCSLVTAHSHLCLSNHNVALLFIRKSKSRLAPIPIVDLFSFFSQ